MLDTVGRVFKGSHLRITFPIGTITDASPYIRTLRAPRGRMSSTSVSPDIVPPSKESLSLLGEDMVGRKAMVLQPEQIQRYFPHLEARGWTLKPGEPSATLDKHFDFGTEHDLAIWTAEMLAYMQRAKHHAQLKIMYKSVDIQTNTHRAYTPQEPKVARPGLSNKDIQLAYKAEELFEGEHGVEVSRS